MSIMVGTGRGAHAGVLIRNAEALETLEKVDTLVIEKTATLTEGKPRLITFESVDGHEDPEMLRPLASLEQVSEHPLAGAIIAGAKERTLNLARTDNFRSVTGRSHRHG